MPPVETLFHFESAHQQTASYWLAQNYQLAGPLPSRERADAATRPGEGAVAGSPCDLPGRDDFAGFGVFGVFQGDALSGKFVADAVGLGPVFGFARGVASVLICSSQPHHFARTVFRLLGILRYERCSPRLEIELWRRISA